MNCVRQKPEYHFQMSEIDFVYLSIVVWALSHDYDCQHLNDLCLAAHRPIRPRGILASRGSWIAVVVDKPIMPTCFEEI